MRNLILVAILLVGAFSIQAQTYWSTRGKLDHSNEIIGSYTFIGNDATIKFKTSDIIIKAPYGGGDMPGNLGYEVDETFKRGEKTIDEYGVWHEIVYNDNTEGLLMWDPKKEFIMLLLPPDSDDYRANIYRFEIDNTN